MSIDYCLDCVARVSDGGVVEEAARHFATVAQVREGQIEFELPGVRCVGFRPDDRSRKMTWESFGFDPTRTLVFRLDKFDLYDDGLANMLRITIAIMRDVVTDAVLLQSGERPLILRRGDRISLQDDTWWAGRLERASQDIGGRYAFEGMPVV